MGLNLVDQCRVVSRFGATAVAPIGRANLFRCYTSAPRRELRRPFSKVVPRQQGRARNQVFERPHSTASFRISTSIVFFPSSRCSSLISLIAAASSDAAQRSRQPSPPPNCLPDIACASRTPGWHSRRAGVPPPTRRRPAPMFPARWRLFPARYADDGAPARSEFRWIPRND
jgi:hypothetical protein